MVADVCISGLLFLMGKVNGQVSTVTQEGVLTKGQAPRERGSGWTPPGQPSFPAQVLAGGERPGWVVGGGMIIRYNPERAAARPAKAQAWRQGQECTRVWLGVSSPRGCGHVGLGQRGWPAAPSRRPLRASPRLLPTWPGWASSQHGGPGSTSECPGDQGKVRLAASDSLKSHRASYPHSLGY